jgi:3-(3-hydroxy-phenyl)propionate hydroxylase
MPHVRYMIRFALAVGTAMTAGGEVGNFLRRVVVPRLHLIPGVREKIVDGTTPALHSGELVVKSSRRRQLAGRLCPNPVLAEGKRFDEVVGAKFALVTSAPLDSSQQDEMASRGTVVVTAPPGTDLELWLRAGRATAAVVRPDRTVLCASRNLAEVCNAVPVFASPADAGADA